jgi:hypothetical protein
MIDDATPDGYRIINYEYGINSGQRARRHVAAAVRAFLYWR